MIEEISVVILVNSFVLFLRKNISNRLSKIDTFYYKIRLLNILNLQNRWCMDPFAKFIESY